MGNGKKTITIVITLAVIVGVAVTWILIHRYNKEREVKEIISKLRLAENERSDGRIIFTLPEGFSCVEREEDLIVEKYYDYVVSSESEMYFGVIASFEDVPSKPEYHDNIWDFCLSDNAKKAGVDYLKEGTMTINGRESHYKIGVFMEDGVKVYVRMYLIPDKETNKICVVMLYDNNRSTEYVDELLDGIRFL